MLYRMSMSVPSIIISYTQFVNVIDQFLKRGRSPQALVFINKVNHLSIGKKRAGTQERGKVAGQKEIEKGKEQITKGTKGFGVKLCHTRWCRSCRHTSAGGTQTSVENRLNWRNEVGKDDLGLVLHGKSKFSRVYLPLQWHIRALVDANLKFKFNPHLLVEIS